MIDEFTRQCVTVEVEYRMNAVFVAGTLLRLFHERGVPQFVRSDNGPEYIARHLMKTLAGAGVKVMHIEPGSPCGGFAYRVAERTGRTFQRHAAG